MSERKKLPLITDVVDDSDESTIPEESGELVPPVEVDEPTLNVPNTPTNPTVQNKDRVPGYTAPMSPESTYEGRIKNNSNLRQGVQRTSIQGYRYKLNFYYSQYIGKNDSTYDHAISSTGVTNQFTRIENLELKLHTPMPNYETDEKTGHLVYSGTATTPCLFIPNMGDLFTAKVDTNVVYLFKITSPPKKNSIFDQAAYEFDFKSIGSVTACSDIYDDLESKVVKKKIYVSNLNNYNENSILAEEDYEIYKKLISARTELSSDYRDLFYDNIVKTLLVPSQGKKVYDPFAVKAFIEIRNLYTLGLGDDIAELNCEDGSLKPIKTIWDVIQTGNGFKKLFCRKLKPISKRKFSSKAYFRTVKYSLVDLVVSPRGDVSNKTMYTEGEMCNGDSFKESTITVNGMVKAVAFNELNTTLPLINPVTNDDYYIFSEAFYTEQRSTSIIEYLVFQHIDNRVVNPALLLELVENCYNWGDVEFFYYVPIILYLIEQVFIYGM